MPQHILDAACDVVSDYPGGASSLAPRIGKNPTTLSHELNRTGLAKLGLLDAVKITQRTGDKRILLAFAAECGEMCLPLPEALDLEGDDCMRAAAHAAREFGELMQEALAVRADGRTSDNELDRVTRAIGELMRALHHLNASFVASNLEGKPAHLQAVAAKAA